jgi:hypothetical protein
MGDGAPRVCRARIRLSRAAARGGRTLNGIRNGFFDGINPPIFTGGTTVLTWAPGIYSGSYGTFTVALAPSAPEASTWAMMLAGFGALGFAALRRRVGAIA